MRLAVIQGQKKAIIITITAAMIAVVAPDPAVILMEDDWSAGMYHSWYVDENGNKIEGSGDYFDRSTGELYDEDGNDLGNLGEWLWD